MPDVHTSERRSYNMSKIRSKDTKPELRFRRALHARGLRYRTHVKELPGKPDVVFPRIKVVIFVDGDYWHGYELPRRRHKLDPKWVAKITGNMARDRRHSAALRAAGWSVIRVWEHQVMKDLDRTVDRIAKLIRCRRAASRPRR
ncbi:very short patch repair endonuclease [Deinococcus maricopensis]|uniref:Very short patch repair endonuclease n=1 Tax=Deinococcus maricopensis (strain DSM 21211 / LMG 22137 / NRRL B-23946 / LB-34) TaxID=709986 RepID=E8U608_DEIML|nr:very short patch repair endonuclease [Deinococcus maricopensis]ADV66497.1 DNA mismatch endonuclease Vsr [Deinococcus maricopensis DSM 21211]